jgi:hypothetical protein
MDVSKKEDGLLEHNRKIVHHMEKEKKEEKNQPNLLKL